MFDAYSAWRNLAFRLGIGRQADFWRQANGFWQAQQFAKAATCYRLHLLEHPDDYGSWLDLGVCEAFVGRKARAAQAYEQARSVSSQSSGDLLALARQRASTGRVLSAFAYYRQAFLAEPALHLDDQDRSFLGQDYMDEVSSPEAVSDRRVFLDITDILRYLRHNNHGTGIQRVLLSMVSAWFRAFRRQDVAFVFCRDGRSQIFQIGEEELAALVEAVEDPAATVKIYQPYLDKIYAEAPLVEFRPGDVFVIMGAFWISIDYLRLFVDLRARGVFAGAYIYDLIAITHPEFINQSDLNGVLDRFGDVFSQVDFVCTISDFVASEVRDILRDHLNRSIPVVAVPLAHDPPRGGDGQIDSAFLKTLPTEYVLCICTIEGRKNHLLLFDVWSRLLAKYGDATPPLIVVGKWGWRSEAFKQRLEETQSLSGKIIVLGNLSDAKVDHLYRHCLFTVFPSFVEGWGLPVGESLACGTPCIASNASSIPEVGGDLVRYIDPLNSEAAFAVIEKPLMDRQDLAAWRAKIASTFRPRTWVQVVDNFLVQIDDCVRSVRRRPADEPEPLTAGTMYRFSRDADGSLQNWRRRAHKFIFSDSWHGIENQGVWSSQPAAQLSILTELAPGARAIVRLLILGAPPKREARINLKDLQTGAVDSVVVPTDKAIWVEMIAVINEAQRLQLSLERVDADAKLDRSSFLGLCALVFEAERGSEAEPMPNADDRNGRMYSITDGHSPG